MKRITRVVGVSFAPGYPANLHRLKDLTEQGTGAPGGERLSVLLRRNPLNPHDSNAIEVHVPALGTGELVGHLAAGVAARLAPVMDDGAQIGAEVFAVAIDPHHPDRPGLEISLWDASEETGRVSA